MAKKALFLCILLCLLAAAAGPKVVSAGVDPLASPTPRPTERITAPVISGVNPDAVLSEGNLGDTHPSGSFIPVGISLPVLMDSPIYVDLKSQPATQANLLLDQPRNIYEVNCGPASLAHALQILDPEVITPSPTTRQLSEYMSTRGLIYDWGTGVEELAYTAREFGYDGSFPFQNWNLELLTEYLRQGRPVVVSLGMNGADNPGHFVTLTGISEDGKWITFQDPVAGKSILSEEEFLSLWKLQGSAGMIPQKESSATLADPMLPWMGLFGAISALALTLNQPGGWRESRAFSLLRKQLSNPRRKGIGGGPLPPPEPEVIQIPRYETKTVYRGINTVEKEVPVYETRKVKVGIRGIKKKVPQYETRRVQVGVESVTKRVPIYSTKKVQTGTRLAMKKIPVTRYRTTKVMVWKKFTKRVPVHRYFRSRKFMIGYKNDTRWKRVPVMKRVSYQSTKTISIQVPVYKDVRVISRYKIVTKTVPKFEQKKVLVGHKIINETIPVFEKRQVQVGTKTVTRQMPEYETMRIPIIDEKVPSKEPNASDGDSSSPPTGFSAEIWNSLSVEDHMKIRKEGIRLAEEQEKINAAKDSWIYKTYICTQETKEKISDFLTDLGLPTSSNESTNLVSLSAYKDTGFDLLKENEVVIDSFSPPNILNLLYMEQTLSIKPKMVLTAFPGGSIDFNVSSQKATVKLGDFSLFGTKGGEIGYSHKTSLQDSKYHYIANKYSLIVGLNGITFKYIKEGVKVFDESSNGQLNVKEVETLQCKLKTIRSEGVLVVICGTIIIASLVYYLLTTGTIVPVPLS